MDDAALDQQSATREDDELTDRRLEIAIDSAGQGVWDVRGKSIWVYVSPAWFKLRGLNENDHEAATFERWLARVHEEDRAYVLQDGSNDVEGDPDAVRREYRERHADGHWIWVLSQGRIITRDKNGLPLRTIGTDTDITALKKSEGDLKRLSHRHELAVSTAKVGVWEYDLEKNAPLWDNNTRELFGVTDPNEILPPDIWDLRIHPEDRARALATAGAAVLQHGSYAMDYRILLPSGEVRHVRCRAVFHEDVLNGKRLVGVNWDVTQDYNYANELRRAKELAEKRSQEIESAQITLEHNALHDALTGLPNRRQLDNLLMSLEQDQSKSGRIAVLHVDLDRFKQINDTLGHSAGDAMLRHVSAVLKYHVGDTGLISRSGGDEFVIVMSSAPSDEQLSIFAAALLRDLNESVLYEGHECLFGASIGIAVDSRANVSGRKLLINADLALYRAKSDGRNRFAFFTLDMELQAIATKNCADEIRRGLERNEFFAVYQLQFDARSHEIIGVEALARWRHPVRGVLAPDQFLQVADEINAVARIDELILQQALIDLAAWRAQGLAIPHMSVNISARRLGDARLIESLRKLDIPENSLSFELLESIYLDNHNDVIGSNLSEIKKLGIGIEIDDFGTGHASIACLLNLRPKRLKIDRQLVKPIVVSVEIRRLLASIVDIGQALGIEVLAEGVETEDHARILRDLDCNSLQGFAFAKPMAAADVAKCVAEKQWQVAA